MSSKELSREELFALVWEKPTQEVARELGVSDVAIAKLCSRLQVPKPPRGYWARVQSGQTPKRPPLAAFREEVDRKRRETARAKAAGLLSKLQQQFYQAALSELDARGADVDGAETRGSRLRELHPDLAAQILLLIQNRGHDWVKEGKVAANWNHSVQASAANLVGKLLPLARPQLLMFESDREPGRYMANGPAVFVRLTAHLQERIASLVRVVRDLNLNHVCAPLVDELHAYMMTEREKLSRHAPVAKAMNYMLARWTGFAAFLEDGRICLSNNAAERALRGIALGRKAWLFAGSDRGARRAAFIYTLIVSAKLNDIDPQAWLADVLARIADMPQSRLKELLPWNWAPRAMTKAA